MVGVYYAIYDDIVELKYSTGNVVNRDTVMIREYFASSNEMLVSLSMPNQSKVLPFIDFPLMSLRAYTGAVSGLGELDFWYALANYGDLNYVLTSICTTTRLGIGDQNARYTIAEVIYDGAWKVESSSRYGRDILNYEYPYKNRSVTNRGFGLLDYFQKLRTGTVGYK